MISPTLQRKPVGCSRVDFENGGRLIVADPENAKLANSR